jgi:hypothetical protein
VFTKVGRILVNYFRENKILFVAYLDDFWLCAPTKEACLAAMAKVDEVLAKLGLKRKEGKGHWAPTQRIEVLGMVLDSVLMKIFVPERKLTKARTRIDDVLRKHDNGEAITKREAYQTAGQIISFARAFMPARIYCRPLYQLRSDLERELLDLPQQQDALPAQHSSSSSSSSLFSPFAAAIAANNAPDSAGIDATGDEAICSPSPAPGMDLAWSWKFDPNKPRFHAISKNRAIFNSPVHLTQEVVDNICWMRSNFEQWNGAYIKRPASIEVITTDASEMAGAAIWKDRTYQIVWSEALDPRLQDLSDIMEMELAAKLAALLQWGSELNGKVLRFVGDSQSALFAFWNGGSRVQRKNEIIKEIWRLCFLHNIYMLEPEWIPSEANPADAPSRDQDKGDWQVSRSSFNRIVASLGVTPTVDRFASPENAKCPRFNTRYWVAKDVPVDCFAQDWRGEMNYVCCPFNILYKVIQLLIEQKATAIVVAPEWTAQPWFALLKSIQVPGVAPCSLFTADFSPGASGNIEPVKNGSWRVSAYLLDGALN